MPQEEIIQLLIKYKNQVTGLICVIIAAGCFYLGQQSVHCEPKEVLCKTIEDTRDKYLGQRNKCLNDKKEELDTLRDAKDLECKVKIKAAIDEHKKQKQALDCDIVKSLHGQCKRRGLIK